jgi:hypothetical protein
MTPAPQTWHFPLPRPHTGVPLGDGITGLLVWGEHTLNLTVARAGFWDHRGANPVLEHATYAEVRQLLAADREDAIRSLFAGSSRSPGQLGGGRLELTFASGVVPRRADLATATGVLTVMLSDGSRCVIRLSRGRELIRVETLSPFHAALRPLWDLSRDSLAARGIAPPERWSESDPQHGGGFLQSLPEDAPLALAWQRVPGGLRLASALGPEARATATARLLATHADTAADLAEARWWADYWAAIPTLALPDPELQHAYEIGCYKQAGLTPPGAPAATLQGPWMEDYQLPPWSNDYHFNINLQLVYAPAYATNRLEHLEPLWAMLRAWLPRLRRQGERFFARPGALLLPHAVDDCGEVIGAFWSGTIDHACAAWVADMAWRHYRYTLDEDFLRELAWPLLEGAFEGFWAMLEPVEEMGRPALRLPVSVSPEYSDGTLRGTWGPDSSFQLAALHLTARQLTSAARVLGRPQDARWARVAAELPPYATAPVYPDNPPDGPRRIALWPDRDLPQSHRHHSHLAALWPFGTIDPFAPEHKTTVAHSLTRFMQLGAGEWVGWSIPWTAQIFLRCDLVDAAVLWLKWWRLLYTNEGHGTLHNADFPGGSGWNDGSLFHPAFRKEQPYVWEVMQSDAGMAAVATILDLLVHSRHDTLHVLSRLPKGWRDFAFDGIRTEGAFLVGATVRDARVSELRITSLRGAPLRLAHGLGDAWTLDDEPSPRSGPVLELPTRLGQTLLLRPGLLPC